MSSIFTPPSGLSKKNTVPEEPPVADLIGLDFSSQEPLTNHGAGHPTESTSLERYVRFVSSFYRFISWCIMTFVNNFAEEQFILDLSHFVKLTGLPEE